MTFDDVMRLAAGWEGVEASTSYGTPALKVRGRLLCRLWEDGTTLVLCGVLPDERDMLIETDAACFFVTDHYRGYPTLLVRLPRADPARLEDLLRLSWQRCSAGARRQKQGKAHVATG